MRKKPIYLLLISLFILAILPQAKSASSGSNHQTFNRQQIDLELLYRKWFIDEIRVNGELMEDEFKRGAYVQINRDKTLFTSENQPGEKEEVRSYTLKKPNTIIIHGDSEDFNLSFKITQLTETNMSFEIEDDGQKVVIKYKSSL